MLSKPSCVIVLLLGLIGSIEPNYVPAELSLLQFKICLELAGIPATKIVVSNSTNATYYAELNQGYQLKPPATAPLAFALVRDECDVIAVVRCCRLKNLTAVPKSGGHSFEKYSFGTPHSIVVDLRALSEVTVHPDGTATVGIGALIVPMAYEMWSTGRVILPIGYCPTVGSSSTLGGGYGVFSGSYGLTVDRVLELRIVLANGDVIVTNANRHSDLFWALRGAGEMSYGIVTSIVFSTVPAPETIYEVYLFYDFSQWATVLDVWQNLVSPDRTSNSASTQMITVSPTTFAFRITDVSGTDTKYQEIRALLPTPLSMNVKNVTYDQYLFIFSTGLGPGALPLLNDDALAELKVPSDLLKIQRSSSPHYYQTVKSFYVDKTIGSLSRTRFQALVEQKPATVTIGLEGYAGAVRSIGNDEMAFIHRGSTLYLAVALHIVDGINDTANAIAAEYLTKFWNIGKDIFNHTMTYQNYPEPVAEMPDYLERYYGNHLPRLVNIKRKYDPSNFFQFPQSIPLNLE